MIAVAGVGCAANAAEGACCPGGACTSILVLGGGSPPEAGGAAVAGIKTFLERWTWDEIPGSAPGVTRRVLAVEVRVEDPTWADHVEFCETSTAVLDAQGRRVCGMVGPADTKAEPPVTSPTGTPAGPRIVRARLLLTVPPASAPQPLYLQIGLCRYQDRVVAFEWRGVGPTPKLPLREVAGGVELTIEKMEVTSEAPQEGGPAQPHLVVRAKARYLSAGFGVPQATFGPLTLIAGPDRRYLASTIRVHSDTERVDGGDICATNCEIAYHFADLSSLPEFADLTLEVRKPLHLAQPFVHVIPAQPAGQ